MTIPKRGQVYSLNDAREPDWPSGLRKYIEDVRRGDGETGQNIRPAIFVHSRQIFIEQYKKVDGVETLAITYASSTSATR